MSLDILQTHLPERSLVQCLSLFRMSLDVCFDVFEVSLTGLRVHLIILIEVPHVVFQLLYVTEPGVFAKLKVRQ